MITRVISSSNASLVRDEMSLINVSEDGIKIMESKGAFYVIKAYNVPLKAAIILKQEMLARGQEVALDAKVASLAVEETDVLIMSSEFALKDILVKLKSQPFGLPMLSQSISTALDAYKNGPKTMNVGNRNISFDKKTHIMGILNVTPDSFSDGGKYTNIDKAIEHALDMVSNGATIIDIGGESSRPGSVGISVEEELERVLPIVEAISHETTALVSVDTYKSEVARRSVEMGAHIINDITAMTGDPNMTDVIRESQCGVVLMHMRGNPQNMQELTDYKCVIGDVYVYLHQRMNHAISSGIAEDRIILDPGIGFAKTLNQNLEIINRLKEFKSLGRPILIGTSRKSAVGDVLKAPVSDRLFGTAATVALSINEGANILRVHDVKEICMVAQMSDAVKNSWRERVV